MLLRILSALVALPVVILAVHKGGLVYLTLAVFGGAFLVREYLIMMIPEQRFAHRVFALVAAAVFTLVLLGDVFHVPVIALVLGLGLLVPLYFLFSQAPIESKAHAVGHTLAVFIWPAGLLIATASLRFLPEGRAWFWLACILAWASDSGAYFVGKAMGRHKLYPSVSPNKTWEGAVGGVVVATSAAFALRSYDLMPTMPLLHFSLLVPVATVMGQLGDLAESLVKRAVGVKDSGQFMPGHGGLFDRVDALVFTGSTLLIYALVVLQQAPSWLHAS